MDDWESHKDLLKTLYLVEKKSLGHIITYMGDKFTFNHLKAQYENHFKKWGFRKNMNDKDWRRVYRRFHQRKLNRRVESLVLFNGVVVPHEKVKREIARHVPLTYQFTSAQIPMDTPSPDGDVMVCTPPGIYQSPVVGSPPIATYVEPELLHLEETTLDRRYQPPANLSQIRHNSSVGGPSSMAFQSAVIVDGNPFFQFQNVFRSEDVRISFEKTFTVKDDLCDDLISNFWPEDSSAGDCPSNLLGMIPSTPSALVDDEMNYIIPISSSSSHSTISLYKPFGIDLIQWMDRTSRVETFSGFDTLQYHSLAEVAIPKILEMMPSRGDDDVQSNAALLLGPPIIRAAHLFVEIGVYLVANNIASHPMREGLIAWMLATVPWSILRPILSMHLPTIKAFAEVVFRVAIQNGDVQVVTDLLQLPILQTAVISSSWYLCEAVVGSKSEIVKLLLEAGSDPNAESYGRPIRSLPLQLVQNIQIARSLVQSGAKINISYITRYERTQTVPFYPPLVAAVANGNFELVEYLIQMGADVDISGIFDVDDGIFDVDIPGIDVRNGHHSVTALTVAVINGRLDISELLLKHGAHVNPDVTVYEVPPLNGKAGFIYRSRCDIRLSLFLRVLNVRVFSSLLEIAVALKSHKIVELLVFSGSCSNNSRRNLENINRRVSAWRIETALQIAVGNGDIKLAEFLLRNGASINAFGYTATIYPITALFLAIDQRDSHLVDLLLRHGADLNVSYHGLTLLEAARSQNNSASIVDMLLAKNAPEVLIISNEERDYELQEAVARGDKEWVKRSLALGGVVNMRPLRTEIDESKEHRDLSILHLALGSRPFNSEIFQLIVAETSDLAAHKTNDYMVPLLHQAVSVDNLEAVEILIRAGADVNEVYEDRTPLISCVASSQDLTIISLLLSSGADLNVVVGDYEFTTALQACLYHSLECGDNNEVFYFLMSKGASINAPVAPTFGLSELAYAALQGRIDIIQFLLDRGADVNPPVAEYGGSTALQVAVSSSNLDIIRLLLDRGADVNAPAKNEWGGTALQKAASLYSPNLELIHLLLDRGADVNAPGSQFNGQTALHSAAEGGHFQIVVLFLQLGADINMRSSGHHFEEHTALCGAAVGGRLDIVQLLLQNGADMNLPANKRYNRAIRLARDSRHFVVTELLENWPTSEAGRKAIAKFGHLYKGAESVEEMSDEDMDCDSSDSEISDEDMSDSNMSDSNMFKSSL